MIIYDLTCSNEHRFEGWFKGIEEFDEERHSGRLNCPLCGDQEISLLPSGGHFAKAEKRSRPRSTGSSLTKAVQDYLERNFDNVGPGFAEEAIRIHLGEIDPRNIRGTMTPEEEKDLQEEGVEYHRIPLLKLQS